MSVTIWTTASCNLKCKYCYEIQSSQRNSENVKLPYVETDKILEWINKNQLAKDRIIFHGGEPLIKFSTIKIIVQQLEGENKLPSRMGMTTNGMVWSNEIELFFEKYKTLFRKDMSISIDGTESMHNMNRRTRLNEDTYSTVLATQRKMIKIFPDLRARMTITPDCVGDLYDGIVNLINLNFKSISASLNEYDDKWTEGHIERLTEQLYKIAELWKENQNLRLPFINNIRYRKPRGKCSFSYNIYPNGDIYPCVAVAGIDRFCIGNVVDGLNIDKINQIKNEISKEYEICKGCNNVKYCIHNRCKLVNYALYRNYDIPNILGCRMESVKVRIEKEMSPFIEYTSC